jgi:hypothetical protein
VAFESRVALPNDQASLALRHTPLIEAAGGFHRREAIERHAQASCDWSNEVAAVAKPLCDHATDTSGRAHHHKRLPFGVTERDLLLAIESRDLEFDRERERLVERALIG